MNPLAGFSLEKVLLHTTPQLLQEYLHSCGLCQEADLPALQKELGKRQYAAQFAADLTPLLRLPKNSAVVHDFCIVFVLAKKRAFLTLLQELALRGNNTAEYCDPDAPNHDKVFRLLQYEREQAENNYYAEIARSISTRQWFSRNDVIPEGMPELSEENREALKNAVLGYLVSESRGGYCQERYFTSQGKDYYTLTTQDQPQAEEYWTAEGILKPSLLSPKMEIIFRLDRKHRTLTIHGDSPVTRKAMHRILAQEIFDRDIPEEPEGKPYHDLEKVLEEIIRLQRLSPKIQGNTPVRDIWVNAIKLKLQGGMGDILLNSQHTKRNVDSEKPDKIYFLLRKVVQVEESGKRSIKREDVVPVWLEFIAAYRDKLTGKDATTRFTFSSKTGSNLGDSDLEEAIRACLIDSGYINGHAETQATGLQYRPADDAARIPA